MPHPVLFPDGVSTDCSCGQPLWPWLMPACDGRGKRGLVVFHPKRRVAGDTADGMILVMEPTQQLVGNMS